VFDGPEVFIVLILALLLFGGSQLPKLARNLGEAQREFKKAMTPEDAKPPEAPPKVESADEPSPGTSEPPTQA
jgi:sec-independent protein translocase protein TatA